MLHFGKWKKILQSFSFNRIDMAGEKLFCSIQNATYCFDTFWETFSQSGYAFVRQCSETEDALDMLKSVLCYIMLPGFGLSLLFTIYLQQIVSYYKMYKITKTICCSPFVHQSLLIDLVSENNIQAVEEILADVKKSQRRKLVNQATVDGFLPLHEAVRRGNTKILETLLYYGASCWEKE